MLFKQITMNSIRPMGLMFTLRPAVHRFADIAASYRAQYLPEPESLQDAWEQFKRIETEAYSQIESGLWDIPVKENT